MFQRNSCKRQLLNQLQTEYTDSRDLDVEYLNFREGIVISQYYLTCSKHIKIRLSAWIHKLDQIIANPTWKRNRNNYIKLIKLICECQTVVHPFDSLPPQADIPKLNTHQINHVIDAIERLVKSQKSNRKGSADSLCEKTVNLKPHDYWSRIRQARQIKQQEQSVSLGRFTQVAQKNQEGSRVDRNTYYSMAQENPRSKVEYREDICRSDIKGKENVIQNKLLQSTNKQTQPSLKYQKQPKRLMVKLSIQPKENLRCQLPQSESKIANQQSFQFEQWGKQKEIHAFKDTYITVSAEKNTLKTEMFDQDISIHESSQHQISCISADQCEFDEDLSERCRNKNQIPNHSYFSWKANHQKMQKGTFSKQKNKFKQITPCKPPNVQALDYSPHLVTVTKSQLQWQQTILKQSGITSKLQMFSIEQSSSHQSIMKDIREQQNNEINWQQQQAL